VDLGAGPNAISVNKEINNDCTTCTSRGKATTAEYIQDKLISLNHRCPLWE